MLRVHERLHYKVATLTYNVLHTSRPISLCKFIYLIYCMFINLYVAYIRAYVKFTYKFTYLQA